MIVQPLVPDVALVAPPATPATDRAVRPHAQLARSAATTVLYTFSPRWPSINLRWQTQQPNHDPYRSPRGRSGKLPLDWLRLRNIGQVETAIELLEAERSIDPVTVDERSRTLADAISAVLALCLVDAGREREAVSIAVAALAPHLPRYQRSMATYARLLVASDVASR
jgi:hypothetical protein